MGVRVMKVTFDRLLSDIKDKVMPSCGGTLPPYSRNKNADYGIGYNLHKAISKFGGYGVIRDKLGLSQLRKPNGYWYVWENVEKELKSNFSDMIDRGVFPSYEQLENAGIRMSCLAKKFGGIVAIADKFNCRVVSLYKCRDGHCVDSIYECIVDEYMYSRGIEHQVHPSLDGRYYADFLVSGMLIEVWGYRKNDDSKLGKIYNKKRKIKEKIYSENDRKLISIECGTFPDPFRNFSRIESDLDLIFSSAGMNTQKKLDFNVDVVASCGSSWSEKIITTAISGIIKEIGKFPSMKDLEKKKLHCAVQRFGGITHFRNIMGYTEVDDHRSCRINWNDGLVKDRLYKLMAKIGRFPSQEDLFIFDMYLLSGLRKCGGLTKFKMMLGFQKSKPKNYWDEKSLLEEFKSIGSVPTDPMLRKMKRYDLLNAASRLGGLNYFRDLLKKYGIRA
jgi:hypothetical protein